MSLFPENPPPTTPIISIQEVRRKGKKDLLELVGPAIKALSRAIETGDKDDYISVKAACAVLDRTGFGIHSTVTIDDKTDYSRMTKEDLLVRLDAVRKQLELDKEKTSGPAPTESRIIEFRHDVH